MPSPMPRPHSIPSPDARVPSLERDPSMTRRHIPLGRDDIPPDEHPSLGATIRAWRLYRGMSQPQLAAALALSGQSASAISALERSTQARMSARRLERFATALDVAPETLARGELPPTTPSATPPATPWATR